VSSVSNGILQKNSISNPPVFRNSSGADAIAASTDGRTTENC